MSNFLGFGSRHPCEPPLYLWASSHHSIVSFYQSSVGRMLNLVHLVMPTGMSPQFGMSTMGHISEYGSHDQIAPIAPSSVYAAAGWNHHPTASSSFHDSHSLAGSSLGHTH